MTSSVLPTYNRAPLAFERGEGCWLVADDGRRYLDLGAGIAVTALGHAHPRLIAALTEQAGKLWHSSNLYRIPAQERLAEILTDVTFADRVFFTNSGTEAMEAAVKMARRYHAVGDQPHRRKIITFADSFHGRSMGMISAAGAKKLTDGFEPLLPGFEQVPFGDLDAVAAAIDDTTAAIMLEPVQGEGGIIPADDAFLRGLRELADAHGILLIFDEIQCGVGRTGRLFAHEWSGVTPDIMGIAKGIGGGFPLGACLATESAARGMVAGTHGSTYGGNPLACAVGIAVIEEITAPGFLDGVRRRAGHLRQRLEGLVAAHPEVFASVRGLGMMLGLVCRPANTDVVAAGYDAGVLVVPGGQNVVRILPPLTISEAEIDEAVSRLDRAAMAVEAAQEAAGRDAVKREAGQ